MIRTCGGLKCSIRERERNQCWLILYKKNRLKRYLVVAFKVLYSLTNLG